MARGRRKGPTAKKSTSESSTASELKQASNHHAASPVGELDTTTAFRRSLAASKPTWYSLNLSFNKMVDAEKRKLPIKPNSKEAHILRDLRESQGAFFMDWLRAFRQQHQLRGDRSVRRNQVVCYLSLVDLVVVLGLHASMPFDFWWEMIEGALYEGAFNDVIEWREGKLEIKPLLKRFETAYKHRDQQEQYQNENHMQPEVPIEVQQQFKPFLDWYCIGAMLQWVDETTPHLPRVPEIKLATGESWYQDETQRLSILKFVIHSAHYSIEGLRLTRTRSQLRDLSKWLELQIEPIDVERVQPLPFELTVAKIFLDGFSRSDKKDVERIAELLVNPSVSGEDKQRLRTVVAPLMTQGRWNDLYLFRKINPDMSVIYDFAIQWKLYTEVPKSENEKSITVECQTYEDELISNGSISQRHSWKVPKSQVAKSQVPKSQGSSKSSSSTQPAPPKAASTATSSAVPSSQVLPVTNSCETADTTAVTGNGKPASAIDSSASNDEEAAPAPAVEAATLTTGSLTSSIEEDAVAIKASTIPETEMEPVLDDDSKQVEEEDTKMIVDEGSTTETTDSGTAMVTTDNGTGTEMTDNGTAMVTTDNGTATETTDNGTMLNDKDH